MYNDTTTTASTSTPNPSRHNKTHTGAIVGGIIGGILTLALFIALGFCLLQQRKKGKRTGSLTKLEQSLGLTSELPGSRYFDSMEMGNGQGVQPKELDTRDNGVRRFYGLSELDGISRAEETN